jgi:hypothetical protein
MDPKIKAIVEEGPNKPSLKDMDLEFRSIMLASNELFKTIDMSSGIE